MKPGNPPTAYHDPVMLREAVEALDIKPDGVYVDVTFGGGGHSRAILNALGPQGKLIGFDQDPESRNNIPSDERFTLEPVNFRFIERMLTARGIKQVDGVLADLGVSSHQFDTGERGFSIRFDGPLDMRMNKDAGTTAAELLNSASEAELVQVFRQYAELKGASRIAARVIQGRNQEPWTRTLQLTQALEGLAPRNKRNQFMAQVFQALRIAVNDELGALRELLLASARIIKEDRRLVVISYHSLEDRAVKEFMRTGNLEGKESRDIKGALLRPFEPMGGARKAAPEELLKNNRARSARMRVGRKTGGSL